MAMTKEEAIRLLDPETTADAITEIEYYGGFHGRTAAVQAISDACVVAVEAMKKQIPKKVVENEGVSDWYGDKRHYHYSTCPVCETVLDGGKYCEECGQKLDWGEDEET